MTIRRSYENHHIIEGILIIFGKACRFAAEVRILANYHEIRRIIMNLKKQLSIPVVLAFALASVSVTASYAEEESNDTAATVALEDIHAIQAFLLNVDYEGTGRVLDMDQDDDVDGFDLAIAKRMRSETETPAPRYEVFDTRMTWTEAKAYCESLGGHLAVITSEEENALVTSMLLTRSDYWIGASDADDEGNWVWVTGEEWNYQNWYPGQPDNYLSGQEDYLCMVTSRNGQWNDASDAGATASLGFVCEWE